jgi:hypothetical protein
MPQQDIQQKIRRYFDVGYTHRQIHYLLKQRHGYVVSFEYLKRKIMPGLGLKRRGESAVSPLEDILPAAIKEVNEGCAGFEEMKTTLRTKYGFRVTRFVAREIVKEIDAEGVARRKARRLKRRQYLSKGPNFVWHIDGYDKLKPYRLCIHGCNDGFNRHQG